jgi:hypothetical protein
MSSNGVTTNLDSFSDYTHVTGLYFEKTGRGRITFQNEMNFTNQSALSWMQQLDSKINMNTVATITMDADLIKNLMNTQATLTMYNITLNDPEIYVDGAPDSGGVVSGLSYDRDAHTLTFTAAHFTTFNAREKTVSSGGSPAPGGAPGCGSQKPEGSPDLFQIKTTGKTATLYFVPPRFRYDRFYIAYGNKPGEYPYGVEFSHSYYPYVIGYRINDLKANTRYYFSVRAGNGCMPGDWSNIMKVKTNSRTYHYY